MREYMGVLITPYTGFYGWRWEALVPGAGFCYSDTLAGMRDMIRCHMKGA